MTILDEQFDGPSFDLAIDNECMVQDLIKNDAKLEFEDLSLLIVEDSMDKEEKGDHIQDNLFSHEFKVISAHKEEVTTTETELSIGVGIGGEASVNETENHFDLNKVHVDGVEECVLVLNKLLAEGMDLGFESEELNKERI